MGELEHRAEQRHIEAPSAGQNHVVTPAPPSNRIAAFKQTWHQVVAGARQEGHDTSRATRLFVRHINGEQLPEADLKWMRGQFGEVGKALVAAAIFALPGGMVLLPAVEKMLPEGKSLIPTAFRKPPALPAPKP